MENINVGANALIPGTGARLRADALLNSGNLDNVNIGANIPLGSWAIDGSANIDPGGRFRNAYVKATTPFFGGNLSAYGGWNPYSGFNRVGFNLGYKF
jgi:hypothetical protein